MKAISLSLALPIACGAALAQGTADPIAHLRACSVMGRAERLECLDKLSRKIVDPTRATADVNNWTISETTSPVNYQPIVTVTSASSVDGANGPSMRLAIHCRGGRTDLAISGLVVQRGSANYTISYSVNDGPLQQLPAASPSLAGGAAFTGDVVRLLQSLPDDGRVAVRVAAPSGAPQVGQFSLHGLKTAREKLAAACKWPHRIIGSPN